MISKDLLEALDHDYVIAFAYGKRGSQCKPWFDELVEVGPPLFVLQCELNVYPVRFCRSI